MDSTDIFVSAKRDCRFIFEKYNISLQLPSFKGCWKEEKGVLNENYAVNSVVSHTHSYKLVSTGRTSAFYEV